MSILDDIIAICDGKRDDSLPPSNGIERITGASGPLNAVRAKCKKIKNGLNTLLGNKRKESVEDYRKLAQFFLSHPYKNFHAGETNSLRYQAIMTVWASQFLSMSMLGELVLKQVLRPDLSDELSQTILSLSPKVAKAMDAMLLKDNAWKNIPEDGQQYIQSLIAIATHTVSPQEPAAEHKM